MNQLKKQLFYFALLISLLLPQTLFSHIDNSMLSFRHYPNTQKNNPRFSRFSGHHSFESNYTQYQQYSNASAGWYKEYLKDKQPLEIFESYQFYNHQGFREYIKTLPGYRAHIHKIYKELLNKSGFSNFSAQLLALNSPATAKEIIQQMHDEVVQEEEQINQLGILYNCIDSPALKIKHGYVVLQRKNALKQSLTNNNLQCSPYYMYWLGVDASFIQTFKLNNISASINGIPIQHVLKKEFHEIAQ